MGKTDLAYKLPEPGGMRDVHLRCDRNNLGKGLAECSAKEIGRHGENIAAGYLESCGFEVLERNWRCFYGEVDIVADHDGTLVMVEVKTRVAWGKGRPELYIPEVAVNYRKLARYKKLAMIYYAKQVRFDSLRFDVVAVTLKSPTDIWLRHLLGAFEWDN